MNLVTVTVPSFKNREKKCNNQEYIKIVLLREITRPVP